MLRGIIAGGVRNPVLVNLVMACTLIGGVFSVYRMVSEAFPEFSLEYLSVTIVYPGASPEDVERAICIPVEESLRGVEGVREVSSLAVESLGTTWLLMDYDVDDPAKVLDDVKERIGQITTFPSETEEPIVKQMVLKAEVINVAVYGDVAERTLKRIAQEVKDDLLEDPAISQVSLSGVREEEIVIEVSEDTLRAHNLTMTQLMAIVERGSLDLPAGTIRTADEEVTLRVTGQRYTARDFEEMVVIESPEAIIRLGDLGRVSERFSDKVQRGRFNGRPAALVSVYKTPTEDSKRISRAVRSYVNERQAWLPDRLKMTAWGDTSQVIDAMISMLVRNGVAGVGLVFITLLFFLDLRTAGWVALGIPVSFSGALILMWYQGQTINLISIFALIMVSGIIVDDAIVLAESVHARRRAGDPPMLASIEGANQMALPVLGASVTTIIAFLPLLYVVGVMGRFIYVLPVIVIAAILSSAVEAFFILPSHLSGSHGEPEGSETTDDNRRTLRSRIDDAIDHVIVTYYRPVFRLSLRYRLVTVSLAVAALFIVVGLIQGAHVPLILLPKDDTNTITARVRLPEGTPEAVTQATIERIARAAEALNNEPDLRPKQGEQLVENIWSLTGGFSGFVGFVSSEGNNLCEVRAEMIPAEQRGVPTGTVIERWRQLTGPIPDALEFIIERQQLGPTNQPIEIRVLGGTLDEIDDATERIRTKLAEYDGIIDTTDDLIPGKREIRVRLRPAARALGLTLDDVAMHLRHGFYGGEVKTLQRGRDQVKVRVRYPEDQRRTIEDLENERIRTLRGDEVLFREVAEVEWGRAYANLWRQDGKSRAIVKAVLDEERANANAILESLEAGFLNDVVGSYNNMTYKFGGDRERLGEALDSLSSGFQLAVIAIYAVLASLLRSYLQPLVIVIALPFGIIGVVAGHLLLGYNLTLMSLFGAVALSGVVVNDSLVLVDAINIQLRQGGSVRDAVNASGELRFRAVVLTSITTVVGLLPILLEQSSRAKSVMPMALSLSFGIMFATALTLFIVPATFLLLNDVRRFFRWLMRGGELPSAESVEEASQAFRTQSA